MMADNLSPGNPSELATTDKRYTDKSDPVIGYFDYRNDKAKEILIFLEGTALLQEKLDICLTKEGHNAPITCRALHDMVKERLKYYNSKFNEKCRPKLSPGLPEEFIEKP